MSRRDVPRVAAGQSLYPAPSRRHGRGVFAARRFRKGEILESCPILSVPARDRPLLERTLLGSYLYEGEHGAAAIALGFGSLYNHASHPNAECELDLQESSAVFRALRAIEPGEEITILYAAKSELWFAAR
jgi:SET domain-containing protein